LLYFRLKAEPAEPAHAEDVDPWWRLDLRGYGSTSAPADGYTKTVMAQDIHALLATLGHKSIGLVGHDIGLMVAYAYAAQYPEKVRRIVLAADPNKSIPAADRQFYAKEYAKPGHMAAGMQTFKAFEQDAKDFAAYAKTPLTMPMLVLSGEKAGGQFLIDQGKLVNTNVEGVIVAGSGHWLMEDAPGKVIPKLVEFLNR
jgi:pimeloyl-ACP methyl ester carboxylesterase